jgi:Domain of unknown function (DUF6362)
LGDERALTQRRPPSPPSSSEQLRDARTGALGVHGRRKEMSMAETGWTPELVAERLAEAADVLARLPDAKMRGYYGPWRILVGATRKSPSPAAAAPEAIDRMDEALGWLCWLEPHERQLVWLRAEGMPWKWITHRLGVGRTTAWQRWTIALLKIATRLNAAAEQNRPNIKPLNKWRDSVLEEAWRAPPATDESFVCSCALERG